MVDTPLFANNATSRLFVDTASGSATLQVTSGDGAKFPSPGAGQFFMVTVEDRRTGQMEIMKCTSRSTDVLNVVRAQEGTTALNFLAGATVSNRLTKGSLDYIMGVVSTIFTPPGANAVASTGQIKHQQALDGFDYSSPQYLGTRAFDAAATFRLRSSQSTKLIYDSALGHNLQAYAYWAAANHYMEENSDFYLEVADGLHHVSTYLDIKNGRFLDIRASAPPTLHSIASIAYASLGGHYYEATIVLNAAVASYVVAGYAVGGYFVTGDNSADAINGAHLVSFVSVDRLTVKVQFRADSAAPAPTSPTTITGGYLMVPRACIRANWAGWDGSAREGFINALDRGAVHMTYLGIAYNGGAGAHDLLAGRGGTIRLMDYCVIAGAGALGARLDDTNFYASRCCIGAGTTGSGAISAQNSGRLRLSEVCLSGGTSETLVAIDAIIGSLGTVNFAGGNRGIHITKNSSLYIALCKFRHVGTALAMDDGLLVIDSSVTTDIIRCSSPDSYVRGVIEGPFTESGNSFAALALNQWVNGGAHRTTSAPVVHKMWQPIATGATVLDFGSIAANSYLDLTITVTGAALGDFVAAARTSTWPAQGVDYSAFVSAADTVTIRAYNVTTSPIDPAAATWRANVFRLN